MANLVRCRQVVTDNMVLPARQHPSQGMSITAGKAATVLRVKPTAAIQVANRHQPIQALRAGSTAQETPVERLMALKPHPIPDSPTILATVAIRATASNIHTHLKRTLHIQATHRVNMTSTARRHQDLPIPVSSTHRLVHTRLLPVVLAGQDTAVAKGMVVAKGTGVLKEDTASNLSSQEEATGSHLSSLEAMDLRLRAGVAEMPWKFFLKRIGYGKYTCSQKRSYALSRT